MIYEKHDEVLEAHPEVRLTLGCVGAEAHLIHHVDDLLLRGVVAHGAHEAGQLLDGHATLQLPRLRRVLFFRADHRVVEEVINVLVGLAFGTTFDQLDEGLDAVAAKSDRLLNRGHVDVPHVDSEVATTTREDVLAVARRANILHLIGVSDQTHRLMRVAIEGKLDETDDFLGGLVEKVLLAVAKPVLVQKLQLRDLASVRWSKASASR
mmetsp:Transcript_28527/g.35262  ORF Transcript_28527/g.35262 Transcript_28527/m.35262 type:complete len:209 (+) Transcript_28527:725-1351(+)